MVDVKMQDAYYLETIPMGTGLVIIITNDQLRNTTSYLLSFLLEIVSVSVRWASKIGYYDFKSSSLVITVLVLRFNVPVFHDI